MTEQPDQNIREVTKVSSAEKPPQRDISITNKMQIALVGLFYPGFGAENGPETNGILLEFIPAHGENFRRIVVSDGILHPENRLIDLWSQGRTGDPRHVLIFMKGLLEKLKSFDDSLGAASNDVEKDKLIKQRDEWLEQALKEREGLL